MLNAYGDEVGFELGDSVKVQQYHTDKKLVGVVKDYRTSNNMVKVGSHWFDADLVYKD